MSNDQRSKQQLLDQIAADIVSDNVCPDLAAQATNLVVGDGNPDADIVLIGEAPGRQEDEQALPFVGASGKFLNEMLADIHLNRNQIYITNIVKYRPPNNRDPLPAEKRAFLPYLQRQLSVIEPSVVVTLGRHPMSCFLPEASIGEVHGHAVKIVWLGTPLVIVPLYHPAAALYNGSLKETLRQDFQRLPEIIRAVNQR